MKNFILYFVIAITLFVCKKDVPQLAQEPTMDLANWQFLKEDDPQVAQEPSIYGTWKLIEEYRNSGRGDPALPYPVENGCICTFNKDNSIVVESFNPPCKGEFYLYRSPFRDFYNILSDSLVIKDFPCFNEKICYVSFLLYRGSCDVYFPDPITMVTFQGGCTEGCGTKWRKVKRIANH